MCQPNKDILQYNDTTFCKDEKYKNIVISMIHKNIIDKIRATKIDIIH